MLRSWGISLLVAGAPEPMTASETFGAPKAFNNMVHFGMRYYIP